MRGARRTARFTTIVLLILLLRGSQFLLLGVVGEQFARIFAEVKGRPAYVVDRTVNLPSRP